jgi:type VI secretion system protein ImpM
MPGAVSMGFFGKLPARGDFVRSGLPHGFVAPWDCWLRRVLAASQAILGDQWESAWLEAPVWRFALPSGQCGPDTVLGVFMPSVDRAGRYFPLTLARLGGDARDTGFLSAAESAGRAAIAEDWAPGKLAEALRSCTDAHDFGSIMYIDEQSCWWTEGGPRRAAWTLRLSGMPEDRVFARMLDERAEEGTP